jgi:hypothetical protein
MAQLGAQHIVDADVACISSAGSVRTSVKGPCYHMPSMWQCGERNGGFGELTIGTQQSATDRG